MTRAQIPSGTIIGDAPHVGQIAEFARSGLRKANWQFALQVYDLEAFCIMPNHVHAVFTPLAKPDDTYHSLASIMHSLKLWTGRNANQLLGRQGGFWQHENYDHVVRNEAALMRIIRYVLNNPVKAGLVGLSELWPWSYCKELRSGL